MVKAQCSLFTQLTVNDQQEDFAIIHVEDGVMRTALWPNATMVRIKCIASLKTYEAESHHNLESFRASEDLDR